MPRTHSKKLYIGFNYIFLCQQVAHNWIMLNKYNLLI